MPRIDAEVVQDYCRSHVELWPLVIDMCSTLVIQQDHPNCVRLAGELDIAGVRDVEAALSERDGDIELDCAGLTFIDAAGLRVIIAMHAAYEARGARLSIVSPSGCVVRLLELTGHDAVLNVRMDGSAL